jgi:hypothetical protein
VREKKFGNIIVIHKLTTNEFVTRNNLQNQYLKVTLPTQTSYEKKVNNSFPLLFSDLEKNNFENQPPIKLPDRVAY